MTKIVINIILTPDPNTVDRCKKINSNLTSKTDFNNTDKQPHISILMGIIDDQDQESIYKIIKNISERYSSIPFEGEVEKYCLPQTGENMVSLKIPKDPTISMLYKDLKNSLREFLSYEDISLDMFYQPDKVEEISKRWILGFENREDIKGSHITLGIGVHDESIGKTISGIAGNIAIFQLGNYCTCENKLFEIKLK